MSDMPDIQFRRQAIARIKSLRRQAWNPGATIADLLQYNNALLEILVYDQIKDELKKN